jgi:hypothetical protein
MKSLKQAIKDNQRFCKYERLLRRIRLRIYEYEDQGKLDKAHRVIDKIKVICGPWWDKRARRQEEKMLNRLRWS